MANISVVVFASPGRDKAHERLFRSLRESDVGNDFKFSVQPEGVKKEDHWRATHELAAESPTEFVIVLEDDVLVNRHLIYNAETWRWKEHPSFGAGWLYNAGGYSDRDTWYRGARAWAMTPGVLYRTAALPKLIQLSMVQMADEKLPWDCAIAWAAHDGGKRIRVHYPSLIEHPNDVPSVLGNPSTSILRTSRGTFRETWRRSEAHEHGYFDGFGRRRSISAG